MPMNKTTNEKAKTDIDIQSINLAIDVIELLLSKYGDDFDQDENINYTLGWLEASKEIVEQANLDTIG